MDWPRTWTGDEGAVVDASVPNLYRRESSTWGGGGRENVLMTVPERYRQDGGKLCRRSNDARPSPKSSSVELLSTVFGLYTSSIISVVYFLN